MYNDNLKATIEANTLAISAMQSQLTTVAAEVEKTNEDIQSQFNKHLFDVDKTCPFIPARMKSSFKAYISESLIRLNWKDYSNAERLNSIDIYYYKDRIGVIENAEVNHRWEISCSSNRLIVNTTEAGWAKQDGEDIDKAKLSLGLFDAINLTSKHIIEFHKQYSENQNKAYTLQSAIRSLDTGITNAKKAITRNNYIRLFKPGGETAVCKFNVDIKPVTMGYFYATRNNYVAFDAVNLLKEGKKGIRVEFVRFSEATETQQAQRWVNATKWLSLERLISLFEEIEINHKHKLEKIAKRAAEEAAEALKTKTV